MKKFAALLLTLALILSLTLAVTAAETMIPTDSAWKLSATSEQNSTSMSIKSAFDGDASTMWHTKYTAVDGKIVSHDEVPHTITVEFGKSLAVSGWKYTPRTGNGTGVFLKYNIYATTDGTTYRKIYEGTFDYPAKPDDERQPQAASWGNVTMTGIKIEAVETLSGYGTAAEINFYTDGSGTAIQNGAVYQTASAGASSAASSAAVGNAASSSALISGTKIPIDSTWKITASSDRGSSTPTVNMAFDGNTDTYWHTKYTAVDGQITSHDEPPHIVTVDFGKTMNVSGWVYTPRTDNGTGTILKYTINASEDGKTFKEIYNGLFDYKPGANVERLPQGASWGNVAMRAIQIVATDTLSGYGTAAEIEFYTGGTGTTNGSGQASSASSSAGTTATGVSSGQTSRTGVPLLNRAGWKATVNSQMGGSPIDRIFDGNVNTYWHSRYTADGPTITGHDNPPYDLEVTFPKAETISGLVLTPRSDGNKSGIILAFELYVAASLDDEYYLLKEVELDSTTQEHEVLLAANMTIQKIKLHITSTVSGYGTLAEFDAIGADASKETITDFADYAANEEKNRMYKIDKSRFAATYDGTNWATNEPSNTLDGSERTFWQTEALTQGTTATLDVDMRNVYYVKEITYLPRQSDDFHGCWLKVNVWSSLDGENWTSQKTELTFEKNLGEKYITFDEEVQARYFEFEILEYHGGRVSCAELNFYQTKAGREAYAEGNKESYVLVIGSKDIVYSKPDEKGTSTIDVAPYIVNGSTLIPLRGLVEQMGATVDWNADTQQVLINTADLEITLQIWNDLVYVKDPKFGDIRYTLLNPPVITENRTFIPVRFVSEQLGYRVDWNGETQTITITKGE